MPTANRPRCAPALSWASASWEDSPAPLRARTAGRWNVSKEQQQVATILDFEHTDASAVMDEFMNLIEQFDLPEGFAIRVVVTVVPAKGEYD
jgi:hypothetical protein